MKVIVGTKVQLDLKSFIFWTKFVQKGYFQLTRPLYHVYSNYSEYQISHYTISFEFWNQICPKTLGEKRKSKHYH